jgi:hypothetical protein
MDDGTTVDVSQATAFDLGCQSAYFARVYPTCILELGFYAG